MTNQTQVQHSPTPWRVTRGVGELIVGPHGEPLARMLGDSLADIDAAFIVRAVNSHEEMLAALEAVLPQYMAFTNQGASNIHHQGDRQQYLSEHDARLDAGYAAIRRARGED